MENVIEGNDKNEIINNKINPVNSSEEVQRFMRLLEDEVKRTGHCDQARAAELIGQLKPVG